MSWSIRVEKLSKMYRIGSDTDLIDTLYGQVSAWLKGSLGIRSPESERLGSMKPRPENYVISAKQLEDAPPGHFWALRDLNFEIKQGDRVGIIGRNGSGKSTLLKILSRITTPSEGQFRYRGRLVSLLEVGTGFHGELSGRDNIFLNAQINGMSPNVIRRKFDEIVEFSEIGEQIDTPVKRYSSGMYMRLAFAVAAHLESDILIVDEVLAVGDSGFQKKCTDKMLEVANRGRTLLFVSHNMDAVTSICNFALELSHGRMFRHDENKNVTATNSATDANVTVLQSARNVTGAYLQAAFGIVGERHWGDDDKLIPGFDDCAQLVSLRVRDSEGNTRTMFDVKENIYIEIVFRVLKEKWVMNAHFYLRNFAGEKILVTMDNLDLVDPSAPRAPGVYTETCTIYSPLLNEGQYRIEALVCTGPSAEHNFSVADALTFIIADDQSSKGVRGNWSREWPDYISRPRCQWEIHCQRE